MINSLPKIFILFLLVFNPVYAHGVDDFNFNVKEITITNNGTIFKGLKRGEIKTNSGVTITANTFKYNKTANLLETWGSVKLEDKVNKYVIFSNKITYFKDQEKFVTDGNSIAKNLENNLQINAETFEYYKSINKIIAKNVILDDKQNQNKIFSNKITYFKDQEKFVTDGNSIAKNLENNLQIMLKHLNITNQLIRSLQKKCHLR